MAMSKGKSINFDAKNRVQGGADLKINHLRSSSIEIPTNQRDVNTELDMSLTQDGEIFDQINKPQKQNITSKGFVKWCLNDEVY